MRKLLNTLFVISDNSYLALENNTVVVYQGEKRMGQYPLSMLEGIISFSYRGASPSLMGACVENNVSLCFMSPQGRFLARASGKSRGNILLRKAQYRISDSAEKSLKIAKGFIFGKVYNARWTLERTLRDHALRVDEEKLENASMVLQQKQSKIMEADSLERLRGIEGDAASEYFHAFDAMILNQKDSFRFDGRVKRPPTDPVNAMLSFGYSILANDCAAALESVGLDAYVGFLHQDRPGRQSLALDLMEEFRCPMVDRMVLTLINRREITAKQFEIQENGATYLNDDGRKIFLKAWQSRKTEELTHPYLEEKIVWGLVPYVQALLLARYIRGDLDGYPPFLWK